MLLGLEESRCSHVEPQFVGPGLGRQWENHIACDRSNEQNLRD